MGNPFVWVELHTGNLDAARAFYGALFDWQVTDVPLGASGGHYTMVDVGGGTGGGMMASPAPGVPPHWLAYVRVDDVTAALARAATLGAKVVQGRTEVPGFGWLGVITDPTGATLGLWQPKA
ncbi:MAG: VOC family protein [Candidatus Rokubacteria bacterium]|nr:VOC family protein [Candidatus Rokubacteria bacterium]